MTKTICFIPARGNSVRVPRKNIKLFHGKPIIQYSIENAFKCGLFDEVVVSTDDDEIHRTVAKMGVLVTRRPTDDGSTGTQELAGAYLRNRPDVGMCCVLYATAPLLSWRDLVSGWRELLCLSDPYVYAYSTDEEGADVGGYYFGVAQAFREGIPLDGNSYPQYRPPARCCDINTMDDWLRAESMYQALHEEKQ